MDLFHFERGEVVDAEGRQTLAVIYSYTDLLDQLVCDEYEGDYRDIFMGDLPPPTQEQRDVVLAALERIDDFVPDMVFELLNDAMREAIASERGLRAETDPKGAPRA